MEDRAKPQSSQRVQPYRPMPHKNSQAMRPARFPPCQIDADDSNSGSISDNYDNLDLDTSYVVVKSEDGVSYNVPLRQLEEIIGPTITIYN